ncbi:tyrosine-type recombinase/integrase [Ruminiclostridium cellulolyticum]|uniref:Integrase family protein n=1 Tax=Ruminiclostridium cellulolyticum (strain ATCC 35319 / DSM 5812 / JCM 6584 / H10) TaxID=394503 RepID=B8I4A1_RUMCH|nr:tyrosine-type recombinase/integrase [Ruminiclostridium cellulolyticum]ACL74455.1 integrase family protein [Ruminiclostridium cellulolyticum H10]
MHLEKAIYKNGKKKYLIVDENFVIHEEALFFSNFLYSEGYAINTIEGYLRDLKIFLEYLESKDILLGEVRPIHVSQFMDYLRGHELEEIINLSESERRKATTVKRILSSLSTFYKSLDAADAKSNSPFTYLDGIKPQDMYKTFLSYTRGSKIKKRNVGIRQKRTDGETSQVVRKYSNRTGKRLFTDEVDIFYKGLTGTRNKLIFDILYETGMRIGELLSLKVNDYSEVDPWNLFGYIYIIYDEENDDQNRQQKTGSRTLVTTMKLLGRIEEYITEIRPYIKEQEYIFVAESGKTKGQPLSRSLIEKVFSECTEKTGIKCTPHMLRHTHLTELSEFGFDEIFLKGRAGHRSIHTTEKYTHPSLEAQVRAYERYMKARTSKWGTSKE